MKRKVEVDFCNVCSMQIVHPYWSREPNTHLCKTCTKRVLSHLEPGAMMVAVHAARVAFEEESGRREDISQ